MKKDLTILIKKTFIGIFTITSSLSHAQEERNIGDFTGIDAGNAFSITVTQGDKCNLSIEDGGEKKSAAIKTEVREDILYVSVAEGFQFPNDVTIRITLKDLKHLSTHGAAEIKGTSEIKADKLNLISDGASTIKLNLTGNEVMAKVSGASEMKLTGKANLLDADVSGAGSLKATEFEATAVDANVSGSASAKVNAKEQLKAKASGASSIRYSGNPAKKEIDNSQASSIKQSGNSNSGTTEDCGDCDTTYWRFGKKKVFIVNDKEEMTGKINVNIDTVHTAKKVKYKVKDVWEGFEFGFAGYMTEDNNTNLPGKSNFLELNYGKSWNFNLNFCEKHIKLYKNHVALTTGLGFEFNRYSLSKKVSLEPNSDSLYATFTGIDYEKNILNANYFTVPLLLELNTNKKPGKSFHLAVGVVGAYKISSKTKQTFESNGREIEAIAHNDFHLNPFKVSATARVGYGRFNLFGTYGLTELFDSKAKVDLIPFSVGVTLIPF